MFGSLATNECRNDHSTRDQLVLQSVGKILIELVNAVNGTVNGRSLCRYLAVTIFRASQFLHPLDRNKIDVLQMEKHSHVRTGTGPVAGLLVRAPTFSINTNNIFSCVQYRSDRPDKRTPISIKRNQTLQYHIALDFYLYNLSNHHI